MTEPPRLSTEIWKTTLIVLKSLAITVVAVSVLLLLLKILPTLYAGAVYVVLMMAGMVIWQARQSYKWKLESYEYRKEMKAEHAKWEEARKRIEKGA